VIGERTPEKNFILDACVLIDFLKADRYILELIVKHLGSVHVISPIISEVKEIGEEGELVQLGVIIIDPDLSDAITAASGLVKSISFQDHLCLLTAKRQGLTCVTNDRSLRKQCGKEGVPLFWGLELLVRLHRAGAISSTDAVKIAKSIRRNNPAHITSRLIQRFTQKILAKEERE
jgi:predicted nucleic acid-binding protein